MNSPLPTAYAVIVMGVSGAGKTTLAQALASTLHCRYIEGDSLHDERCVAKMRSGQALTDEDRWPWLERVGQALNEASTTNGIAVGACSALRKVYRDRLRASITVPVRFILLQAPRASLEQRMRLRSGHYMPRSLLESQLATLELPTNEEDVLMLDASLSPKELTAAACHWLQQE